MSSVQFCNQYKTPERNFLTVMHWSWKSLQDHVVCLKLAVILVSGRQQLKRTSNVQKKNSIFACDVTKEEDAKQLMGYIEAESDSLVHAHFAPSCGTCSRAREIKVPGLPLERQPQPLRSNEHPDGLPCLSEADQKRVCTANDSYSVMVTLILFLITWHRSQHREPSKFHPLAVLHDDQAIRPMFGSRYLL